MYLFSFDPGKATGVAIGEFDENTGYQLIQVETIPDGVRGIESALQSYEDDPRGIGFLEEDTVVIERYVPDHGPGNPIALEVIGAIKSVAYRRGVVNVHERTRAKKAQVPDKLLKEHGLWRTGKQVGWEDGADANDAIRHAIGYLAFDFRHGPTLTKYYGVDDPGVGRKK